MTDCINEWDCVCDTKTDEVSVDCHCLTSSEPEILSDNPCTIITQEPYEQALSIFLFLYVLIVIIICTFWLFIFYRARNRREYVTKLNARRPFYMLLSYIAFLPWIFENSLSLIYLYWSDVTPSRDERWDGVNEWTFPDGSPIYYSIETDYVMHFFWWFGFWAFVQLKVFKLWMLRYDYEYGKEMSNIEWRDHLGLRTIQRTSFFIRYRSILGNGFLMFFLQLVILVIIIFIQIFIRLIPGLQEKPESQTYEQIIVIIWATIEFGGMFWLMHQIRNTNDNIHLSPESKRLFIVAIIGLTLWIVGSVIAFSSSVEYIWVRSGTTILVVTWICCFCYIETLWLLKKLDQDWQETQHQNGLYSSSHAQPGMNGKQDQSSSKLWLKLSDVLQTQEGFEAMMRFLVKEFSCENLLCYVELSQYIVAWTPKNMRPINKQKRDAAGYSRFSGDDDTSITTDAMMISTHPYHINNKSSHLGGDLLPNNSDIVLDEFPYFENPQFKNELGHYEYIMQKYIYDSACLQINISGGLRQQANAFSPGVDSENIIKMVNTIRNELWSLMRDSFTRFRSTPDHNRLLKQFEQAQQYKKKSDRPASPKP